MLGSFLNCCKLPKKGCKLPGSFLNCLKAFFKMSGGFKCLEVF